MTVPVLASLLCGVIVGQAAGLLAFMLYHRRGILSWFSENWALGGLALAG